MRDKDARKRLLVVEARVHRIEAALELMIQHMSTTLEQDLLNNIWCSSCNMCMYNGFVCADSNCPHGFDADEVKNNGEST